MYNFIENNLDELKSVVIVSGIKISENGVGKYNVEGIDGLSMNISHSEYEKCERCWTYDKTVGKNKAHPTICERCVSVLE